ncbi:hypothetical protein TRIUR3_24840 [Triticum urartu]|uniref:Uncharacterized protein n=1 Tax=Triticum urartu TaxID=4572 RepID=M7YHE6_TRIUA|nr:hypothetical protein TRIUR3_24840 [Triticum urartu]
MAPYVLSRPALPGVHFTLDPERHGSASRPPVRSSLTSQIELNGPVFTIEAASSFLSLIFHSTTRILFVDEEKFLLFLVISEPPILYGEARGREPSVLHMSVTVADQVVIWFISVPRLCRSKQSHEGCYEQTMSREELSRGSDRWQGRVTNQMVLKDLVVCKYGAISKMACMMSLVILGILSLSHYYLQLEASCQGSIDSPDSMKVTDICELDWFSKWLKLLEESVVVMVRVQLSDTSFFGIVGIL